MADLKAILDPVQVPESVKAGAWDAFRGATDKKDFQARFDKIALPAEAKAALWDAKFGGAAAQPKEQYNSSLPTLPSYLGGNILRKLDEGAHDSITAMTDGAMDLLGPGKTRSERLGGVSQIGRGVLNSAGTPLMLHAGVAAPVRTALGLGVGIPAVAIGSATANAFGAGPGTSQFVGDATGLAAGGLASSLAPVVTATPRVLRSIPQALQDSFKATAEAKAKPGIAAMPSNILRRVAQLWYPPDDGPPMPPAPKPAPGPRPPPQPSKGAPPVVIRDRYAPGQVPAKRFEAKAPPDPVTPPAVVEPTKFDAGAPPRPVTQPVPAEPKRFEARDPKEPVTPPAEVVPKKFQADPVPQPGQTQPIAQKFQVALPKPPPPKVVEEVNPGVDPDAPPNPDAVRVLPKAARQPAQTPDVDPNAPPNPSAKPTEQSNEPPIPTETINRITHGVAAKLGMDHPMVSDIAKKRFDVDSMADLEHDDAVDLLAGFLKKGPSNGPALNLKTTLKPSEVDYGDLLERSIADANAKKAAAKADPDAPPRP